MENSEIIRSLQPIKRTAERYPSLGPANMNGLNSRRYSFIIFLLLQISELSLILIAISLFSGYDNYYLLAETTIMIINFLELEKNEDTKVHIHNLISNLSSRMIIHGQDHTL